MGWTTGRDEVMYHSLSSRLCVLLLQATNRHAPRSCLDCCSNDSLVTGFHETSGSSSTQNWAWRYGSLYLSTWVTLETRYDNLNFHDADRRSDIDSKLARRRIDSMPRFMESCFRRRGACARFWHQTHAVDSARAPVRIAFTWLYHSPSLRVEISMMLLITYEADNTQASCTLWEHTKYLYDALEAVRDTKSRDRTQRLILEARRGPVN
jgi:hypothetical protein